MTVHIYGSFKSRTRRVIWAALELGLDFQHIPYASKDPVLRGPDYLSINPFGRIPALRDGDVLLSESLAINLHIAKQYDGGGDLALYPEANEAAILQWTLFAASDLDPWVGLFRQHSASLPEPDRVPLLAKYGREALERSLQHLEAALTFKSFLIGDKFTIADLNVASVLQLLVLIDYPFDAYPHVDAWLKAALARPAAQAAKDYP